MRPARKILPSGNQALRRSSTGRNYSNERKFLSENCYAHSIKIYFVSVMSISKCSWIVGHIFSISLLENQYGRRRSGTISSSHATARVIVKYISFIYGIHPFFRFKIFCAFVCRDFFVFLANIFGRISFRSVEKFRLTVHDNDERK